MPAYGFKFLSSIALWSLSLLSASSVYADLVTDFTGLEVEVSVVTTSNGGQDFNAALVGSSTATIDSGTEFVISLTAGDFGGGSNENFLSVDFDSNGQIVVDTAASFYYGAFYFPERPSFDINFDFTDSNLEILSAVTSGGMPSGNHFRSSIDPVVWSFQGEWNGGSSFQIGFNPSNPGPIPRLQLSANSVPEPVAIPILLGCLAMGLTYRRRTS